MSSLRMRLFVALAAAVLFGALVTGLYAVAADDAEIGFTARLVSVAPKALVLAGGLLLVAAAAAAFTGRLLARSVEELADAASRVAEGDPGARLPSSSGREVRRITRALASLRREVDSQPYTAAFLRDAWHDLKTPLASIRASVELLEDGALEDRPVARRFVANVARAAGELDQKLADLVTLARFETAALTRERSTTVGAILGAAVDRVVPLAAARGVELRTPARADRPVRCDPDALARAIGNLLENAVDATPGGRVDVTLAGDAGGGVIALDVVNEPASVPAAVRSILFQRAATAGKRGGSGLGLAIARAAVEAHGGRVRFLEMGPPRVRVRLELP